MDLSKMLGQAARQINADNYASAEKICHDVLQQVPNQATAWYYLSMIEQYKGNFEIALENIEQAIKFGGLLSSYCMLKGNLMQDLERLSEAEVCFREVIRLKPKFAQAYNNLGIVLRDQRKNEDAIEAFSQAVSLDNRYFRAFNNLGIAFQSQGRLNEAIGCYQRAISIDPSYFMAKHNLAIACLTVGNRRDAEGWFREVLSTNPDYVPACLAYGRLLLEQRKFSDAEACCLQAVKVDSRNIEAFNLLGEVWATEGKTDQALSAYQQAMVIDPKNLRSAMGLSLTLPPVYRDTIALEDARARFEMGLHSLQKNAELLVKNPVGEILEDIQWNNFYLAYQGKDDKLIQKAFSSFVEGMLQLSVPHYMKERQQERCSGRRIRIGFMSRFFYECTVGNYFKSWITGIDNDKFEIFVYHTNSHMDKITEQVKSASDHFKYLPHSLLRVADELLGDDLDILIYPEVGMNAKTCVLSAMRLAPVQCAGWGHPVTTGHKNIDYYFSSILMEPPNAQSHYTEKLVLLPGMGTSYPKPDLPDPFVRTELALPEGKNLYLCPQSMFKIHPGNDELFLRILEDDENGVLVFFAGHHEIVTNAYIGRLVQAFKARGMDTTGRVKVLPYQDHDDYLRVNMACDVMLDSLFWSGGNTSLDALSCGLPIVTLPGEFMRGRQSYGMLRAMGIEELIASDEDDYVRIALKLGMNPEYRKEVSSRILDNAGKIFGDDEPVKELQRALLNFVGSA